jgi:hypothetical protein
MLTQLYVRFEVFTAVTMKNAVFWDVTPCSSCVNWRFGGTFHFQLQRRKIRERGTGVLSLGWENKFGAKIKREGQTDRQTDCDSITNITNIIFYDALQFCRRNSSGAQECLITWEGLSREKFWHVAKVLCKVGLDWVSWYDMHFDISEWSLSQSDLYIAPT